MEQYSIYTLFLAVEDFFCETERFHRFLKSWGPGCWSKKPAGARENYERREEVLTAKRTALKMMCKLVNVDYRLLIPVVKAINRWERNKGRRDRYLDWDFLNYRTKASIYKMLNVNNELFDDKHYLSTGREIKA